MPADISPNDPIETYEHILEHEETDRQPIALTLLVPFIYLMIDQGYDSFYDSFRVGERSDSPTGLPARWAFKAIIPISFVLLAVAATARLLHDLHALYMAPAEEQDGFGLRRVLLLLAVFAAVMVALTFLVETTEEKLVIAMFLTFIALLFTGYPVAWVLAGGRGLLRPCLPFRQ